MNGTPLRVLVVEGHDLSRFILTKMLSIRGQKVYSASDLDDAVYKFQETKFDMVLLDLNLPELKSLDFATELIRSITEKHGPVVGLANRQYSASTHSGIALGCHDMIFKPYVFAGVDKVLNAYSPINAPNVFTLGK